MDDNRNVVYLEGEACTINATADITEDEFLQMATWCLAQHQSYLATINPDNNR